MTQIDVIFSVDKFRVTRLTQTEIASKSYKFLKFKFQFSSEWDGLSKTAKITTGGTTYSCVLEADNTIADTNLPQLIAGDCLVSVTGTNADGVIVYTTKANTFTVVQGDDAAGTDPVPVATSYGAQVLAKATAMETDMTAYKSLSAYDAATAYAALNHVVYGGECYQCIAACTGVTPGTDAAKWVKIASKGEQGIQGIQGNTGAQGAKGDTGSGFVVKGYYATLSALTAAVTSPSTGDAYGVGSAAPYSIYIWSGEWVNNGSLQGAKGDTGSTFTPSVSAAGVISWTNNGGLTNPASVNIKGPAGTNGVNGTNGTNGTTAYQAAVAGGYTGTEAQFNAALAKSQPTLIESTATTYTIASLADNTEYYLGTLTALTITAFPTGHYHANISFTAGASMTISKPTAGKWVGGSAPTTTSGRLYELDIRDGKITVGEFY